MDVFLHIARCPGPYFRQLAKELGMPIGTLKYHLDKLTRDRLVYTLGRRPRYFPYTMPVEEAAVVYLIREGPGALDAVEVRRCGRRLCPEVKELAMALVRQYPCLQRDLVSNFIDLFSQLL